MRAVFEKGIRTWGSTSTGGRGAFAPIAAQSIQTCGLSICGSRCNKLTCSGLSL